MSACQSRVRLGSLWSGGISSPEAKVVTHDEQSTGLAFPLQQCVLFWVVSCTISLRHGETYATVVPMGRYSIAEVSIGSSRGIDLSVNHSRTRLTPSRGASG